MSDVQRRYPESLEITPFTRVPQGRVNIPGSKSITNRAFVLAALGNSIGCELHGILHSEDTEVMMNSLTALGFHIETTGPTSVHIRSTNCKVRIPAQSADLYVANSGTTMRFLSAMVSVGKGRYRLDGIPRMRERPIQDLLTALQQMGINATSETNNGCPPVVIQTTGLNGGHVRIRGDVSSQFLSAILMIAPFAKTDVIIEVEGVLVSEPYVEMTVAMMRQWGLKVSNESGQYAIPGNQNGVCSAYHIEPDASAASYFFALAAITGGRITVPNLSMSSLQGDIHFVDALEKMGCTIERNENEISVQGPKELTGIDIDMNAISDTVMTLGAVACFAEGPTTIRNVGHIRHKETDRITALANELRKVGAEVEVWDDGLRITPDELRGALIATYNDHRMAMSLALVGVRVPGIVIENPGCVAKTYPGFFDDLEWFR